jgi:hypothetical protein
VDHLAEQQYALIRIFFKRFIADLDGVLDPVTKTKMSGNEKMNRTKI